MADVVGGFLLPHDPLIFQMPDAPPEAERTAVLAAYDAIRRRVAELGATTAIVIGADHYILFGPGCLPAYLIGVGDLSGPIERMPDIAQGPVVAHPDLAMHIRDEGVRHGFDWAVAKSLKLDHSIMIPHHLCLTGGADIKTVPVYLASGVAPYLPKRRAFELGKAIGSAVRSFDGDERVVIMGSGGISHWVGQAEMGRVNPEFDNWVLQCVEAGDAEALIELEDTDILNRGGAGAMEIRNFLCAMGAVSTAAGLSARTIAYVPSPAWITGLGFSELLGA